MVIARPYKFGQDQNLRQPKALKVLFLAEMWERFSFYGMRSLLVLYMNFVLRFPDTVAYSIYGTYMALVYAMPIIGGLVADRFIGNRRAVFLGGILMACGHFSLALPSLWTFHLGLGFLICGNGFFKANISSLLGEYYHAKDPRRDAGFTIFYMGINIGAFFSPLLCGFLGEMYGFHYGFALAGVGMFCGLFVFWRGQKRLEDKGRAPDEEKLRQKYAGVSLEVLIYLFALLCVPLLLMGTYYYSIMEYFMPVAAIGTVTWLLISAFRLNSEERKNVLVFLFMCLFIMTFFSFFEQAGSSVNLFTERNVDRLITLPISFWNTEDYLFEIPTTWFQALNPFFIVLLGPFVSWIWKYMSKRGREPQTPIKFFLGIFQLGLGFLILSWSANFANSSALTPLIWITLSYLLQTTGELCLSPIGLSMATKLAPQHMKSALMGALMFSIAFAHHIASLIAQLMSVPDNGAGKIDASVSLVIYTSTFEKIAYAALCVSVIALLSAPLCKNVFSKVEGKIQSP